MDPEIIKKIMLACVQNDIAMGIHKQQKEQVKIVFSDSWLDTEEFDDFCREINTLPGEFVKKINRPTGPPGPPGPKVTLYISKDIEKEHFEFSVYKLKRNQRALNDCLTDLLELWKKDTSGKLKKHYNINEKIAKGYLKVRDLDHPETGKKYTHEDIRQAIINYQLWARAKKENNSVWFQKWDLNEFLRSNKAIHSWCYNRQEMIDKVGEEYFDTSQESDKEDDPIEYHKAVMFHLKEQKKKIDRGEKLTEEWQDFWFKNKHLLDEE